jgi:hypothetical protein
MTVHEFEEWVNTPGNEIFTASSPELEWAIKYIRQLEDCCFSLAEEKINTREKLNEEVK